MKGGRKLENQPNIFLIDWLTVTSHCDSVESFIDLLGMDVHGIGWEEKEAYMNGYPMRKTWDGVTLLYGGRDDMGVCLTMSGAGCRTFESNSNVSWMELLSHFAREPQSYNITRLDLAFDDHSGILDIERILDDTDDHYYVSKSKWWKAEYGSEGTCIYHGSPTSRIRFRIYDKAAERGLLDGTHWIRVECQLRDKNAFSAVENILRSQDVGLTFSGILRNYLTYREPNNDSNRSRWPIADYWEKLLGSAEAIKLWSNPGVEYNVFRLERWLVDQCGAAITCWSDIYGLDNLLEKIRTRAVRRSPKYQRLVDTIGKQNSQSMEQKLQILKMDNQRLKLELLGLKSKEGGTIMAPQRDDFFSKCKCQLFAEIPETDRGPISWSDYIEAYEVEDIIDFWEAVPGMNYRSFFNPENCMFLVAIWPERK